MNSDNDRTKSVWMKTVHIPSYPPLQGSTSCDVCVIGAGIAGLTTAYLLSREGKTVVVIDAQEIGGGETSRTTAHLTNALDDRYFELERLFGGEGSQLAAESHRAAIDKIEEIVRTENIQCDFERLDGFLFVPPGESKELLDRELSAAHRAGLSDIEMVPRAPLRDFDTGAALRFPRQAAFDPLKYLVVLAKALEKRGGRIFGRTKAGSIKGGKPGRIDTADGGHITARSIVVATNIPVNDRVTIHAEQSAYRSYVIGVRVPRDSVTRALYWDTAEPYHYVRLAHDQDADLLIVGGEDHKTGQADDADLRYAALERWTRERFPQADQVEYRWSGQIIEPFDSLAFIGHNPGDDPSVFIATGFSGNGMTHGTIAGMLLTDLILERENRWAKLYNPSRITTKAGLDLINESANFIAQYRQWITPGETDDAAKIRAGGAAILRRGIKKIAAYRDSDGQLHECSAICPHLGCIVAWNSSEKTWDCPCHGSRFTPYGKVINGPTTADLSRIESP
jgi:glycine/D-amino acid oxidase-like deaminating enzyme/nitrite reductase/ring-hydroxylating ferredoxin subunit